MESTISLIDRLENKHCLDKDEYKALILSNDAGVNEYLRQRADAVRRRLYGDKVFIRGLIETGNICRNDCYYCGIRASNGKCERFRLTRGDILPCCEAGYALGFRTFVMQSGEGSLTVDEICDTVRSIKEAYPDCAVTLSLGEYDARDYERMYSAGADRYLLRHETADKEHYKKLHPPAMSFEGRMECLRKLKTIGFHVGCGFMVGSPYQSVDSLTLDLKFIESFSPDMCGIGPFIPHKDTPFAHFPAGSVELTCKLLSIIRLIKPNILLPATTALGSLSPDGREQGLRSGANVVMPNLSPAATRKKYSLYNGKLSDGAEAAEGLENLKKRIAAAGYRIVTDRGDPAK